MFDKIKKCLYVSPLILLLLHNGKSIYAIRISDSCSSLIGGFAVTPGYGQANPTTTRESVPVSIEGAALCGGETIQASGRMNLVSHVTLGPDGMFQYSVTHLNFQGVNGVTTSGDRVVLSENQNTIVNVRQISASEFISQTHATLITQGKATNTLVEIQFRTIINANGEPTSTVERFDVRWVFSKVNALLFNLL